MMDCIKNTTYISYILSERNIIEILWNIILPKRANIYIKQNTKYKIVIFLLLLFESKEII